MSLAPNKIYKYLFLLLTFISVNQWSPVPIGNTTTTYILNYTLLICFIWSLVKQRINILRNQYTIVGVYLCWALFEILRGFYVAENYWEWKNFTGTIPVVLFPLIVFVLKDPIVLKSILKPWYRWALLAFVLFFYWMVGISQFYLGPLFFALCFLSLGKNPFMKIVIVVLGILMLTDNIIDNRSQFIKAAMSFLILFSSVFHKFISTYLIRVACLAVIIATIILLYLGLTGNFNLFKDISDNYEGRYTMVSDADGELKTIDMSGDTRTFIYEEVLGSAIKNDYILVGRTPARGHDAIVFAEEARDLLSVHYVDSLKIERHKDEICFTNIFTWLGLVGVLLYMCIYLYSAYLGLFKSNSKYVKLCGAMVVFYFAFGWIENSTSFYIINVTYWIFISICLSSSFRKMTDKEFKLWFRTII